MEPRELIILLYLQCRPQSLPAPFLPSILPWFLQCLLVEGVGVRWIVLASVLVEYVELGLLAGLNLQFLQNFVHIDIKVVELQENLLQIQLRGQLLHVLLHPGDLLLEVQPHLSGLFVGLLLLGTESLLRAGSKPVEEVDHWVLVADKDS